MAIEPANSGYFLGVLRWRKMGKGDKHRRGRSDSGKYRL